MMFVVIAFFIYKFTLTAHRVLAMFARSEVTKDISRP